MIPSGMLARNVGAKSILLFSIGIGSASTLLTPVAAKFGDWHAVCALRVINGLAQGAMYPCYHDILSKWIPPNERGLMISLTLSGKVEIPKMFFLRYLEVENLIICTFVSFSFW